MHIVFRHELIAFAVLSEFASKAFSSHLKKILNQRGITNKSIANFAQDLYEQSHQENNSQGQFMEISYTFADDPEGINLFIPILLEVLDKMKQDSAFKEENALLMVKKKLETYATELVR